MRIYIGNLPFSTSEDDLRALFEVHGPVVDATVVTDRRTGRSRGFGFVEMRDPNRAVEAVRALNDHVLEGRTLVVDLARPREDRRRRERTMPPVEVVARTS